MSRNPASTSISSGRSRSLGPLNHIRERVHWVLPDVEEAMKQSKPAFSLNSQILLKRIATAIESLSEGKRRHWKYENC